MLSYLGIFGKFNCESYFLLPYILSNTDLSLKINASISNKDISILPMVK